MSKADSGSGEFVEVGSLDEWIGGSNEIVAMVIGENEENIGSVSANCLGDNDQTAEKELEDGNFHESV